MPRVELVSEEKLSQSLEREDTERREQIDLMLAKLPMSRREKQFVVSTAEQMVDLVCDLYVQGRRQGDLSSQCIAAAATVAMMIVDDG